MKGAQIPIYTVEVRGFGQVRVLRVEADSKEEAKDRAMKICQVKVKVTGVQKGAAYRRLR